MKEEKVTARTSRKNLGEGKVTATHLDEIAVKQRGATEAYSKYVAGSDEAVDPQDRQMDEQLQEKLVENIEQILEEQVRPYLETHGGGIELIKYEDAKVYVKMFGGCQGCASSALTLREGIETILKGEFSQIEELVDLTDHDAGERPYF